MARNEPWSAITHLIGAVLSIASLVILVVFASLKGSSWQVVSFSIFGASMILLYTASTLYHFFYRDNKTLKEVFRRIDHSMIFVLIAGTYTPICLVALRGGWGWSMFGVAWGLAITGIVFKSVGLETWKWLSTLIYVLTGWIIVIAVYPLTKVLPLGALLLLFAGGIFYTVGAVLYAIDDRNPHFKTFGMHEYFHLFVLAGTASHVWMIMQYLLFV